MSNQYRQAFKKIEISIVNAGRRGACLRRGYEGQWLVIFPWAHGAGRRRRENPRPPRFAGDRPWNTA
jgi:hypothetical protein